MRKLWSVSIDDSPVTMSNFEAAERTDINMRGLIGLVPLVGLKPDLRKIRVIWNPDAGNDVTQIDDRYDEVNLTFVIPITFAPDYELSLQQ